MNRLQNEKSPYLRQHAENPVEWYAWNDETLALAKKLNKPIFLSIGYSTCHWCHVMAHESFENKKIAAFMNQHFVNIKVDREERPDVDAIYMMAVQALTGSGGWPMSVWLTPELKPYYAGTYFPPEDRYGRPGFSSVLEQLAEIWSDERAKIFESADQITDMLAQYTTEKSNGAAASFPIDRVAETAFGFIEAQFDSKEGGFGPAPKFPMPVYMNFLLEYFRSAKKEKALTMAAFTMQKISAGGIYDHLGGGFARYATDDKWVIPHFEKMLYDNAQLISVAAVLYELTKNARWANLVRDAIGYVRRDLAHAAGGFYSAEDADSEGKEGTFYLWTLHELAQILNPDQLKEFLGYFPVTVDGNFVDPHVRETGKNVLTRKKDGDGPPIVKEAKRVLFEFRARRPRPHRDEKILTEWNGLMISALVKSGSALNDETYIADAARAADFVHTNLFDDATRTLYRSWCDGSRSIAAQQSDYAMLVQALLDLYDATKNMRWLDWASALENIHDQKFFDHELGGYFMNEPRPDLLIRLKDSTDNVIPSGNSVAVSNGLRLSKLTGRAEFREYATKTIAAYSHRLQSQPGGMVTLIGALLEDERSKLSNQTI